MSAKKPSPHVAAELQKHLKVYLSSLPDNQPIKLDEKYLDFLKENASPEAYQYSLDCMQCEELISE